MEALKFKGVKDVFQNHADSHPLMFAEHLLCARDCAAFWGYLNSHCPNVH